jgi:hypothetical protein
MGTRIACDEKPARCFYLGLTGVAAVGAGGSDLLLAVGVVHMTVYCLEK